MTIGDSFSFSKFNVACVLFKLSGLGVGMFRYKNSWASIVLDIEDFQFCYPLIGLVSLVAHYDVWMIVNLFAER